MDTTRLRAAAVEGTRNIPAGELGILTKGGVSVHMRLSSFHGGHSSFGDGDGEIIAIAESARDKGFEAFGFSEHFDCPPLREAISGDAMRLERPQGWLTAYAAAVENARDQLKTEINIFLGSEVEFVKGEEQWTIERLAALPYDYLVGSVHYLEIGSNHILIDASEDVYKRAVDRAGSVEELSLLYFGHVEELLNWDLVDIIGHIDLIKIFNPSPRFSKQIRSYVTGILETMRDHGIGLDVNPAGLNKPCRQIYPAPWILREAARIGVVPVLGDDSHSPEEVGRHLDDALDLLRSTGHRELGVLVERKNWARRDL